MPAEKKYETDDPYDYRWTRQAFDAIQEGRLHRKIIRSDEKAVAAAVFGACPRCEDPLSFSLPLSAVITGSGVLGHDETRPGTTHPVDVTCGCETTHPGAPSGVKGCGIVFRVEVKEGRDG